VGICHVTFQEVEDNYHKNLLDICHTCAFFIFVLCCTM
jgi:hypothetical protein